MQYIFGAMRARARGAAAAMAPKMDESRWTLAGAHWTFGAVFPSSLFSLFFFFPFAVVIDVETQTLLC